MINRELKLLPHQYELLADDKTKIIGLTSGYGAGKTFAIARKAVDLAIKNAGYDGIITEPNYPLLTQILIPEMSTALEFFGIPHKFNKSESIFYCNINNKQTRIICKSMESIDRLIGINAAWVLMDEFDTTKSAIAYNAYLKLLGRIRVGNIRQMAIVSTPEGYNAMYKIFVEEIDSNKRLIKAKTTDNKHLPLDYIQTMRGAYPTELIDAYLNGEFVNLTSGSVYREYKPLDHDSKEIVKEGERILIGQDFNVRKMASVIFVQRGNSFHAVGEFPELMDTPDVIRAIKERYPDNSVIMYPDSSGKNTSSKSASVSDIGMLREHFSVRVKNTNPRIKDRVLAVNTAFNKGRLFINKKNCPQLSKCVEQQSYDKNGEPDKASGHDHFTDAFGYMVAYEMPISKPILKSVNVAGMY